MSFPYIFKNIPTSSDVTADNTFQSLGTLGYTGSLQDRVKKWLADEGFEGSLDDRLSSFRSGVVFTPASLFTSGEDGAWYDPSDLSTLSQTSTGTLGNVSVGDPVGYMADLSGNRNHATQATAAARPVLRQSGGLYYLEGDGVDDKLTTLDTAFTVGEGFYIAAAHMVTTLDGDTSDADTFGVGPAGTRREVIGFRASGGGVKIYSADVRVDGLDTLFGANIPNGDTSFMVDEAFIGEAWHDESTLNVQTTAGGSESVAADTSGVTGVATDRLHIALDDTTNNRFYGGVFVQGGPRTADERTQVREFLAAKSGVTL